MESIQGKVVPARLLPFSPGIRSGGFVFVSGQASTDADGKIVADSFAGEMRRAMENLKGILDAAGLTLADVVQVRAYLDSPAFIPEYNQIYREYFHEPYPARTTLSGCLGGVVKFEIDVVARDAR
ncbi:RidA family protein [Tundrisphaera lichenicola]|uniref:RidA family protein n=1 Tax=Tundrisphaera lichenicola TaxID=2029860 RepID=UPI003EBC5CE7